MLESAENQAFYKYVIRRWSNRIICCLQCQLIKKIWTNLKSMAFNSTGLVLRGSH